MAAAATLALVGAACGSTSAKAQSSSASKVKQKARTTNRQHGLRASLTAAAQSTPGTHVSVASVTLPATGESSGGYLALQSDSAGSAGSILGEVHVSVGTHHGVVIPLSSRLTSGNYFVSLFPGSSKPTSSTAALARKLVHVTAP